jgi:hypothetical protein
MYKTVTLPADLFGCEAWFLILREEKDAGLSENMALTHEE